jgi:hypothetical protein
LILSTPKKRSLVAPKFSFSPCTRDVPMLKKPE